MKKTMANRGIIILLLWMSFHHCFGGKATSKRDLAQDRIHLQKSQPYPKEESGFFSRIASWIFPFTGDSSAKPIDSVAAPGHQNNPQYLPPPQPTFGQGGQSQKSSECNPCNREPWIPIAGKSGRNTIIHFVPPQGNDNKGLDGLNPPPQYGAPAISQPPNEYYGPPPNIGQDEHGSPSFGTPSGNQYLPPYQNQYGPPKSPPRLPHKPPQPPSILPQPPRNLYGPPAPQFKTKPSSPVSHFGVSSNIYEVKDYMVPPPLQNAPVLNYRNIIGMSAPPYFDHIPTTQLNPVNPHNIQDILQPPVSQHSVLEEDFPPYTRKPLESHNADVQGIEQIPLSSGDNDDFSQPIAFPNLSIRPLVPLHNFVNFHQGAGVPEKVESIQILPSIPLGDYISSIEHPINVIQSPIVDLSIINESSHSGSTGNSEANIHTSIVASTSRPNTIQSGLFVNPSVTGHKLNENPIVVDDTHAAASSVNETVHSPHSSKRDNQADENDTQQKGRENFDNDLEDVKNGLYNSNQKINEFQFTQPPVDYSQWTPTWSGLSMEISPPPLQSTWLTQVSTSEEPVKKTKHVQIIIPYYNFNRTSSQWNSGKKNEFTLPFSNKADSYTTLLPVYKPPSSSEKSMWSQFLQDLSVASTLNATAKPFKPPTSTQVYNIRDILGHQTEKYTPQQLPFDILTFQKNIDEWTQQAFAKTTEKFSSNKGVIQRLNPSKNIPNEYLTTVPYDYTTLKPLNNFLTDHETAGSSKNENFKDDIGNDLSFGDTTTTEEVATTTEGENYEKSTLSPFTLKSKKSLWNLKRVTVPPVTKEKVYIVTPASVRVTTLNPVAWSLPPKVQNGSEIDKTLLYEHPKFSIRIEEESSDTKKNESSTTKVIFSEWPHKINNLQTTSAKPNIRHPLFGLIDSSAYIPPDNQKVEIINKPSKVQ